MYGQLTTQFQAFALLLRYEMQQVGVFFGKSDRFTMY
jgi:hypothetical protein